MWHGYGLRFSISYVKLWISMKIGRSGLHPPLGPPSGNVERVRAAPAPVKTALGPPVCPRAQPLLLFHIQPTSRIYATCLALRVIRVWDCSFRYIIKWALEKIDTHTSFKHFKMSFFHKENRENIFSHFN